MLNINSEKEKVILIIILISIYKNIIKYRMLDTKVI